MGKHLLTLLLGGFLALGVSTAFAEEPPASDQEILKAWGVTMEANPEDSFLLATESRPGLTPLTDESLDAITGAGPNGVSEIPPIQFAVQGPEFPAFPEFPEASQFPAFPAFPAFPTVAEFPAFPDFPAAPESPAFPEFPTAVEFPAFPAFPVFPGTP